MIFLWKYLTKVSVHFRIQAIKCNNLIKVVFSKWQKNYLIYYCLKEISFIHIIYIIEKNM